MTPTATNLLLAPASWLLTAISRLPLQMLYPLATILAWLARCVVRYRLDIVRSNLEACFPQLSSGQRREIERRFYRNFADYIVETLRMLTMSPKEMKRRIEFTGLEHISQYVAEGKSVAAYFSHTFNWEWVTAMPLAAPSLAATVQFGQVYRPLRNRWFDTPMLRHRSRFGAVCIPKATVLRTLLRARAGGLITITGFMSDQKPSHGDPTCHLLFLNRPTAMITGTETLIDKLGLTAVYFDLQRTSRGHYRISILPMNPPHDSAPWPLTRLYASMLENSIRRDPAEWLWTHNRWKHPVTL